MERPSFAEPPPSPSIALLLSAPGQTPVFQVRNSIGNFLSGVWKLLAGMINEKVIYPLTARVKPWVIQIFLTFDSMERTLNCNHFFGKLLSRTLLWFCLVFNFTQVVILKNVSVLDLAPSGVRGLPY